MELRDYIEEAAKKAGSVSALARILGMNQPDVSNAKAMKKRLPTMAVVQMADYIGADLHEVIAANELVTEKDEKKRAFWHPFVTTAKAASIALAVSLVTNFVTPTPAEASSHAKASRQTLYYVNYRLRSICLVKATDAIRVQIGRSHFLCHQLI